MDEFDNVKRIVYNRSVLAPVPNNGNASQDAVLKLARVEA
jgi:hypothetical protein